MKIIVVSLYAIFPVHLETDLEIIQTHVDAGDEVLLLVCNEDLLACDPNPEHRLTTCIKCIGRRVHGIKQLSNKIEVKPFYFLTSKEKEELKQVKEKFSSLAELKDYKIDNFDIGWGVLSSLSTTFKEPEPDLSKHKNLLKKLLVSSLSVYRSIQNHLSYYNPDKVYILNGRLAPLRAVLRACESKHVDCFLHDLGSTNQKYIIFKNVMVQDLNYNKNLIEEAWSTSTHTYEQKEKMASDYYEYQLKGSPLVWISYTDKQKQGLLPNNWDDTKINIVIFTTSEDELTALGRNFDNPIYRDQFDGIKKTVESLRLHNKIQLYIRIHPYLRGIYNSQVKKLFSLNSPNLTIIEADSPISTYALMQRASKVLTFGSTIGIEATFWGIPSILLGKAYYEDLGVTYNPTSHEELINMLFEDLKPKDKKGTIKYGYYFGTYGIPYKYDKPQTPFSDEFNGVKLKANLLPTILIELNKSSLVTWTKLLLAVFFLLFEKFGISILLNKIKNLLKNCFNIFNGFIVFIKKGITPPQAYYSMQRLYIRTNGWFNDFSSFILSLIHPKYKYLAIKPDNILKISSKNELKKIASEIQNNGYYIFNEKLSDEAIDKLIKFARLAPTIHLAINDNNSLYPKDLDIFNHLNIIFPRYDFIMQQLFKEPIIQEITTDQSLLAVVQEYLNCKPVLDLISMWWSIPFNAKGESEPAQMYGFDMNRIKFINFFFYLTDVGSENGPFCFTKRSHKRKPKELLRYGKLQDNEIESSYSKEDIIEIIGAKGTIVAADTRGLHKWKSLTKDCKCILQIKFANSLFGENYQKIDAKNKLTSHYQKYLLE